MSDQPALRDRVAVWICNFILAHVATKGFTEKFALIVAHGMDQAELGKVPGLVRVEEVS